MVQLSATSLTAGIPLTLSPWRVSQDTDVVDASVDQIARAIFDRWTRGPVIEFAEGIEDAIFLEAASRFVWLVSRNGCAAAAI